MKKMLTIAFACLIFISLQSCTKACQKSPSIERKVLRIGTNANYPPFETIDKTGGLIGFDIDMGRELAKSLDMDVEFKEFDFDALILALKKGQIDIIMSALSITKSRQQEIAMVPYQGQPITEMALLFWQNIPEPIESFADLKNLSTKTGLSISVQSGHFLEGFLRDEGMMLKPLAGPPEQILDIKYKKSLAAGLDGINGKNLAHQHPELKIVSLALPEDKWDLGFGIGIKKDNTELEHKIREAVSKLREDKTIEKLENKWLEARE